LASDVSVSDAKEVWDLRTNRPPPGVESVRTQSLDVARLNARFTAWLGEWNQVWQGERHVTVGGARFQAGAFDLDSLLDHPRPDNPFVQGYYGTPVQSRFDEPFQRGSLYAYHTQEVLDHLRVTAGLAYDSLDYPANFRSAPVSGESRHLDQLSPKAGLVWNLPPTVTLRGMAAQTVGGLSYEDSVRLDPTQLAGFSQAFRSVISEAEAGSVVAPRYDLAGLAVDVHPFVRTFAGVQAQWLAAGVDQDLGTFRSYLDFPPPARAITSTTAEQLQYEERSLLVWASQLLDAGWSIGASYRLTDSELEWSYPELDGVPPGGWDRTEGAMLHVVGVELRFQDPSGFFTSSQCRWFLQQNSGYGWSTGTAPRPDDATTQLDFSLGYRFPRRRAELAIGCLNALDEDYRLNSLTPYPDLPHERVWFARLTLQF
jgi:hypothetical protein